MHERNGNCKSDTLVIHIWEANGSGEWEKSNIEGPHHWPSGVADTEGKRK